MESQSDKKNKVTIMIPTHNQELYIGEAIESALAQDYENLEIVVSNDCSTDNTERVIMKYLSDNRIRYFKNEKNLGRVGNYHKTLYDYATGDWTVNLDGDDYYIDPHFVSRSMDAILCAGEEAVVFSISSIYARKSIEKKKIPCQEVKHDGLLLNGINYFTSIRDIGDFNHYSLLYNRRKAMEIGFYTKDCLIADFHSGIRLAIHGSVIILPYAVAKWRAHGKNATTTEFEGRIQKNREAFTDIADYACKYIDKDIINVWLNEAYKLVDIEFFQVKAHNVKSIKDLFGLVKMMKPKGIYLKTFCKSCIHYTYAKR